MASPAWLGRVPAPGPPFPAPCAAVVALQGHPSAPATGPGDRRRQQGPRVKPGRPRGDQAGALTVTGARRSSRGSHASVLPPAESPRPARSLSSRSRITGVRAGSAAGGPGKWRPRGRRPCAWAETARVHSVALLSALGAGARRPQGRPPGARGRARTEARARAGPGARAGPCAHARAGFGGDTGSRIVSRGRLARALVQLLLVGVATLQASALGRQWASFPGEHTEAAVPREPGRRLPSPAAPPALGGPRGPGPSEASVVRAPVSGEQGGPTGRAPGTSVLGGGPWASRALRLCGGEPCDPSLPGWPRGAPAGTLTARPVYPDGSCGWGVEPRLLLGASLLVTRTPLPGAHR